MGDWGEARVTEHEQALESAEWRVRLQQALASSGLHSTLPRRLMVSWIAAAEGPFTAEALVAELAHQRGGTRATVYRFIEWLREQGWVDRVHSDAARHSYIRRQPGHRHQAICTSCGATLAIGDCAVESSVAPQLAAVGFEIQGHVLEIFGRCGSCRGREGPG
jgi:Fur family transcriptional regulator, ferric uptake regulator